MKLDYLPLIQSTDFEERYYLFEESQDFGSSGNKTLFKAYDSHNQQDVLIKIYSPNSPELLDDEDQKELAEIRHRNLVLLLDMFRLAPSPDSVYTEPLPVLVMNYVTGQPLSTFMFPLAWPIVETIEKQLVAGLTCLHEQGWVHRDVKPDNVLIKEAGSQWTVILCDLEQAGRINSQPNSMIGTPEYMAPGIASWQPLQANFDFWSLGCLLYELLTGELPFGKRDFALQPLEGVNLIQERIRQTDLQQTISQVPASFQSRLTNYWANN